MKERLPKLVESLQSYNFHTFISDLIAGVTVGFVALPLAMAFAISSGVAPQAGMYCAIIAGFLISALGGSKTQIGGPTGAFVVVVYGIVSQHGLNGLFLCTIMAGVILIVLGLTGLGRAISYIPRPVIVGFTNGIAILIAAAQIKDFFGLRIATNPEGFSNGVVAVVSQFHTLSIASTLIAIATVATIVFCKYTFKRIPGSVVALILGTVAVTVFRLPVETIGSRFGEIPGGLPTFEIPQFSTDAFLPLLAPALTVAMLGAIESLMSAVVADRMSDDKHSPNVELVAQGVANVVTPFFGGLPATGAIARTATNIRSGAKTPVAGIIHSLTLLAILLFAAPLVQSIPLAVLAAILLVVAYHMGEWKEIPKLLKLSRASVAVWLSTLLLTVFADLTIAVEVGIVLAALLYIRDVTHTTTVSRVTQKYIDDCRLHVLQDKDIPEYVTVVRIHGPFLFGATEKLSEVTGNLTALTPVIILRLRNMTAIDATGMHALEEFCDKVHAAGRHLIVCGAQPQPSKLLERIEFQRRIGRENICPHIHAALERARALQVATLVSSDRQLQTIDQQADGGFSIPTTAV